ncbi:MAG TPA: inositol monophosphatase [Thermomicrobiales bacterium]|nr:inositol monophosphatase [Thermomicrobiales bacterium]
MLEVEEAMRRLAVRLARDAGDYAVERLDSENGIRAKGDGTDVVTEVDREAERRIIAGIVAEYPDHAILGEESGIQGDTDAPYRWIVDPLDGTNNYVMGMPMFGACITVCRDDEPVAAVVHDSMRAITTSAVRGGGAFRNGRRLPGADARPLPLTTISWSQGYSVGYEDPFRNRALRTLGPATKRILHTWSPSIDWTLLAAGHTGAFVLYRNEVWDLVGGLLIAEEAGCVVWHAPDTDCVIAGRKETVREVRELLGFD